MSTLNLTKESFKAAAKRMKSELAKRGLHVQSQSALQVLAKALYDKPYEELEATILTKSSKGKCAQSFNEQYTLLNYGGESILLKGLEYVTGNYPGTDLHVNESNFYGNALTISGNNLKEVDLPVILMDEHETDDVIDLAVGLGLIEGYPTIFDAIEKSQSFTIDGTTCQYGVRGDYMQDMEIANSSGENPLDVNAWMPESIDQLHLAEYYFTFKELSQAKTEDGGKTWSVMEEKFTRVVEFFN